MLKEITTKQVETNIDLKVNQEVLIYVRDYLTKYYGEDFRITHENISKIVNHIEGSEAVVAAIPSVYPPSVTDPVPTADKPLKAGSFYFNTKTKKFMNWSGSGWVVMADLKDIVDLSDYMKIDELYQNFVSGYYGTLEDLYKVENGETVVDRNVMVLNLTEIAELVKDQREIDRNFLANFKDELTYKSSDEVVYKDTTLELETLKATVNTNGNSFTYSTLIRPYDRINQEQANFEGKFEIEASAQYLFSSKFKAVKFEGIAGKTYKWETIAKFEGNGRVPYIRFTGTATMKTSSNPLDATSWVDHPMPYEIKLSDLMDENNRTAIVTFNFPTRPGFGTHFMTIEYLTSTYYVESRFANLIKGLDTRLTLAEGTPNVQAFPMEVGGLNNVVIKYKHTDLPANMKVGDTFILNINPELLHGVNDTTTMLMQDESKASSDPTQNFASLEAFQWQANNSQADKDAFTYARRWGFFKDMVEAYWVVVRKDEDFDGKTIWIPQGWRAKPQTPGSVRVVGHQYAPNQIWAYYEAALAKGTVVGITAYNTNQIETNGSALWKDSYISFNPQGYAMETVSNLHPRQFRIMKDGIWVYEQGVLQRQKPLSDWAGFTLWVLEGKAFVDTRAATPDPTLPWVNVGQGHGDQVLGFTDAGKIKFQEYFNRDKAAMIFEPKTYDYSATQSSVNLNVTGGKRFLIITQHADAPNTPFGGQNKIWIQHPAAPQDNDQVTYGSDLIWIVKKNGDIMQWHEIKDHVINDDKMIIQHLDNGNWELVGWEVNTKKTEIPFFGEFADETTLKAATGMVKDEIAYEEANDIWWHYDGLQWVHHVDSGGGGGTPGATISHLSGSKVSIADHAGETNQGSYAVAIGNQAGKTNQKLYAVAIGPDAGTTEQGTSSIAIGTSAGHLNQGKDAVAIGAYAGRSGQGDYAVGIGYLAGMSGQTEKSIIFNASTHNDVSAAKGQIVFQADETTVKIDASGIYINGTKVV